MSENGKTPTIRFAGFTEPWVEKKLGEIATFAKGSGYSKDDLIQQGVPIVLYGRLYTKYQTIIDKIDTFAKAQKGSVYSKGHEVLVPASGETAEDIARASALAISGVLLGGDLNVIYPAKHIVPSFLALSISSGEPHQMLEKRAQGKSIVHLHNSDLNEVAIRFPQHGEQIQITAFFRQVDNLITLQRSKLDRLVRLKKSMLEKMFPQDGADTPEIRFAGFTGAWVRKKLGEIADKVTEKNVELQYIETFTNSAEFGIISQRDFFDHSISKMERLDGYYVVKNDDFVYNPRISVSAPVGPINRNKLGRVGVMSPLYTVFRPHDIDATYLEYFFKCSYWYPFMRFHGDSGARSDRFSIRESVFSQMPIPLPTEKEEQARIGSFFRCLDTLIAANQSKLEKLRNIKKSCLEKMFV